ncbi:uncharacterized protein [Nicotiana tomentosiformis]|uniref:uncharacterized protein n=1 Tax=Nicotiana tomentosiformis TaxID=4098 RepID=UPI00388CC3D2
MSRFWEVDLIWSGVMLPKQRVLLLLANQQKLLTKERLLKLHIPIANDTWCCLCDIGVLETHQHLFADCSWVSSLKGALTSWSGIPFETLQWIRRRHWRQFRKEVAVAIIGAMVYHTWQGRNWKIFREVSFNTDFCIGQIQKELKQRINMRAESRRARKCQVLVSRFL